MRSVVAMFLMLAAAGVAFPQSVIKAAVAEPALVPRPAQIQMDAGAFYLTRTTRLVTDPGDRELRRIARMLAVPLGRAAGDKLTVTDRLPRTGTASVIRLTRQNARPELAPEGYELEIRTDGVLLRAPTAEGIFRGVQTVRQLLPVAAESSARGKPGSTALPCLRITDQPRFPWRGLLLDCGRHFMSKDYVKHVIDALAYHKLNRLHWHLTEDQGWRIEIKAFPRLTRVGAWRGEGAERYGGFYTQADIREIVAYARERYVTVVPEIEMPGHCTAALAAYPGFSCTGGPFAVTHRWGVFDDVYCAGNDATFRFLEKVLDEVAALFPGEYIHIGADECPKTRWQACPKCQARISAEGLKDEAELQSWFIRRIAAYLRGKGKRVTGWDEIMEGGLAEGVTVQYWRGWLGERIVTEAAAAGNDVIVSPTSHCYIDYPWSVIDLAKIYTLEPVPAGMPPEHAARVLGGEANMWTEYAPQSAVDGKVFPRLAGLAEVLWSPREARDWADFSNRMNSHYDRLAALGIAAMVPPPRLESEGVDGGPRTVRLTGAWPGAAIRYTLDGTAPRPDSSRADGPIRIERTATIRAAAFHPGLTTSPEVRATIRIDALPAASPNAAAPGLRAAYYPGNWNALPDYTRLRPAAVRTVSAIDVTPGLRPEFFGLRFTGWLDVPADGDYTFTVRSDDVSRLFLDGVLVVDCDGAHHRTLETSGRIPLRAGRHALAVDYLQILGSSALTVYWEGPGFAREELPAARLAHVPEAPAR